MVGRAKLVSYLDFKFTLFYLAIGIEANDVGTLLEQFLEYEEKQGILNNQNHVFRVYIR